MNVMVPTGQASNVAQNTMLTMQLVMFTITGDTNFLRLVEIGAALDTTIRMVRVAVVMHSLRL